MRLDLFLRRGEPSLSFGSLHVRPLQVSAEGLVLPSQSFVLSARLLEGIRHNSAFVLLMAEVLFGFPEVKTKSIQPDLHGLLGVAMGCEGLDKENRNSDVRKYEKQIN